jgi:hypothetical protein
VLAGNLSRKFKMVKTGLTGGEEGMGTVQIWRLRHERIDYEQQITIPS